MSRIDIPTRDEAPQKSQSILDAVDKQLGFVPNLHRLMSISPTALAGWVGLQSQLAKALDANTRDAIALAVSEVAGCSYCLAAHSYIAANVAGMSPEEIALNRRGRSNDPRRGAAVRFAKTLIERRGHVSDTDVRDVRAAGFTDREIVEIVALSAQFQLTNFMNNVAGTVIDFPQVGPAQSAA